jgi:NAD-dependent deacetylase
MAYQQAAEAIRAATRAVGFTGAGISVESGIPPFRGEGGLWNRYDPALLQLDHFLASPDSSWKVIREIFYDFFGAAVPNAAHRGLAELERLGLLQGVITQNIDNLHQDAGSRTVHEFHGTAGRMICLACREKRPSGEVDLQRLPPTCPLCGGLLKPDFIFFGEGIPEEVSKASFHETELADLFILVGTTGEVMPACLIPSLAKQNGATIIEINVETSNYGRQGVTDIFLQDKATTAMNKLFEALELPPP